MTFLAELGHLNCTDNVVNTPHQELELTLEPRQPHALVVLPSQPPDAGA